MGLAGATSGRQCLCTSFTFRGISERTLNFVSLGTYFQLARQARQAEPASFRPPGEVMRRVYGLQTSGGGRQWKLEVSVANLQRRILPEAQSAGSSEVVMHETSRECSNEQDDLDIHSVVSFLKLCQERPRLVADVYRGWNFPPDLPQNSCRPD